MNIKRIATITATLAVAVTPAASQAATRSTSPTVTPQATVTTQSVRAGSGTVVFRPSSTTTVARLEAGSAGVDGFDDGKCQQLADLWSGEVAAVEYAIMRDDTKTADFHSQEAADIMSVLDDNCSVVQPA